MAPPVTSAVYSTAAYATQGAPAGQPYSSYPTSSHMHAVSQPPSQQSYAAHGHPQQRVEVTQGQTASPSMAHLPSHQSHQHQAQAQAQAQAHAQAQAQAQAQHAHTRPSVSYAMPGQYQPAMGHSPYGYASVNHTDPYRRTDPTAGGLPSMRTLDHSGQMPSGHMGPAPGMMMMQHHEMGYYGSGHPMMGHPYSMSAEILGRYPISHDPRFNLSRNPKKEIKRRTKTGCMTCRKRRIKCDETHPTCNNCKKSKRECLGYDPIFKQQNQGQPAPHLHQPQQQAPSQTQSQPQSQVSQTPVVKMSSSPVNQSPHVHHQQQSQPQSQTQPQPQPQQQQPPQQQNHQLPPPTQQTQHLSRPTSQTSSLNMQSSLPSVMSVSCGIPNAGLVSSGPGSHQLPGTPSTQSSFKATPPLGSSAYSTPASTTVSASSYDSGLSSQSPSGYDYSASIDPALQSGAGSAQPRPGSYHGVMSDHSQQPRMVDHLPNMRHAEASML